MRIMLSEFIDKKLKSARYKKLKNGNYFVEIPGVRGVWASAKSRESCKRELRDVLEEWLFLKLRKGERISGFSLRVDRRDLVKNA